MATRDRKYTRERRRLVKAFNAAIDKMSKLIDSDDPAVAMKAVDKLGQLQAKLAKLQAADEQPIKDDGAELFDEAELTAELEQRMVEPAKNLIQSTAGNALEGAGRVDPPVVAPLTPSYCEYPGCSEAAPISFNGGFYCRPHSLKMVGEVGAGPVEVSEVPDIAALLEKAKDDQQKRYLQRYDPLTRQLVMTDLDAYDPYSVLSIPVSQAAFNPLNGSQLRQNRTWSEADGWRETDIHTGKVGESDRERLVREIREGNSK